MQRPRARHLDAPLRPLHTSPVRVFICYRRDDSWILIGRLFDRLSSRFGFPSFDYMWSLPGIAVTPQ